MDERNSDGEADDAFGDEDPTKVELGDHFALAACGRLADALSESGRALREALDLGKGADGAFALLVLDEVATHVRGLKERARGSERAVVRLRRALRRALRSALRRNAR